MTDVLFPGLSAMSRRAVDAIVLLDASLTDERVDDALLDSSRLLLEIEAIHDGLAALSKAKSKGSGVTEWKTSKFGRDRWGPTKKDS